MISLYFTHGPTGMTLKHITCLDKSQSPAWLCIRSSLPRWLEFTLQYTYLAMGKSPKFHHELKNYDNYPTHGWIFPDFPLPSLITSTVPRNVVPYVQRYEKELRSGRAGPQPGKQRACANTKRLKAWSVHGVGCACMCVCVQYLCR